MWGFAPNPDQKFMDSVRTVRGIIDVVSQRDKCYGARFTLPLVGSSSHKRSRRIR